MITHIVRKVWKLVFPYKQDILIGDEIVSDQQNTQRQVIGFVLSESLKVVFGSPIIVNLFL